MAPHFCSPMDLSRYPLRAPNSRGLESSIDATTVSSKIDFLRCMGLARSSPQQKGLACALCHEIKCICDMQNSLVDHATMKAQYEIYSVLLKPCSVQITGIQCKVCRKLLKCESDVRDHMKKSHRHRLKVTLKFDKETMSTKWIRKRYLKRRHRTHSGSENSNNLLSGDSTKPQDSFDGRPCSAPSLGTSIDLPFCQTENCHCCLRNNIRPWDDNNNNNRNNNNCSTKSDAHRQRQECVESPLLSGSETFKGHHRSSAIACQTPNWLQGSTTSMNLISSSTRIENDKQVITLDDTEDLSNDVTEIPIEPPCYDLTEDLNYKSDDEVEKVLEIRKNQFAFITPKRELDDAGNGLRISEAIRDLLIAENSLSNHDQENHQRDVNTVEDNDEENDFTLRFDDSEESCTFIIKDNVDNKEYSKSYTDDFFEDTHLEMAVDHHDALEQSSNFWQTPTKNVERFSAFETPSDYAGDRYSAIAVKEELTLDHYLFDRE